MTAEVTIASWNLHWGTGLKLRRFPPFDVVEGCRQIDTDVLALQESWCPDDDPDAAQHVQVARAMGYEVAAAQPLARAVAGVHPKILGPASDRHLGDGDWTLALLTRLPVTRSWTTPLPRLRLDRCERVVLHADLAVTGHTLTVHATHLPHLEQGSPRQARTLRESVGPADRPAVLLGDMNMWSPCIAAMAPKGWRRTGRGATYPAPYPHSRIDHLLHTRGVEVREIEVLRDLGSDHRPIRARLAVVG
jgi:endonuclease/exonuclease/phosphatase family metal-dependent hydrolase